MSGFANDYKPSYIATSPTTHITQLEGYYSGRVAFGDHYTVEYGSKSYHYGWMRNRFIGNLYWHSDIGGWRTPLIVNESFRQMRKNMGEPILSTSAATAGKKSRKHSKKSLKYKNKSRKLKKRYKKVKSTHKRSTQKHRRHRKTLNIK